MIGRIHGTLLEKQPPYLLIDVNGVAYEVAAPMTTIYDLPAVGESVTLITHFVVREDAQQLYGFLKALDRKLFRQLIKVNGVGPKLALTILSGMSSEAFIQCIQFGDSTPLVKIPGIGKKTAERLMLDMRDAIAKWGHEMDSTINSADGMSNDLQDALAALMALGYKEQDARKAITKLDTNNKASDIIIREALKVL